MRSSVRWRSASVLASVTLVATSVTIGTAASAAGGDAPRISVTDMSAFEGNHSHKPEFVRLPIQLSSHNRGDFQVTWAISGGSAQAGSDYVAVNGPRTVDVSSRRITVFVPIRLIPDTVDEPDETVEVTVLSSSAGQIVKATGTLTIVDDDPPASGLTVAAGDTSTIEGDVSGAGSRQVPVHLTLSAPRDTVTVLDWVANGAGVSDLLGRTSGSVRIRPRRAAAQLVLHIQGNRRADGDRTLTVEFSSRDPAVIVSRATATITIADDDRTSLWAWGANGRGQLGLGDTATRTHPVRVGTSSWAVVSAGQDHTLAVASDGSLWAWGANGLGQLGLGDTTDRRTPTRVGTWTDWVAVAAGEDFSLGIRSDGSLWAWGANGWGQLGVGDTDDRWRPTRVGTSNDWVAVSAGRDHSLGLRRDATLWSWGRNNHGQLGFPISGSFSTPIRVGAADDWIFVAAGEDHSLGIRGSGTLWAWGRNNRGQLGLGDTTSRSHPTRVGSFTDWVHVSGGESHTLGIRSDGSLWAWGRNNRGQLGLGSTTPDVTSPVAVGTAVEWQQVSAGRDFSLGLRRDGTLWSWGRNDTGQLGLGDWTDRYSPTRIGSLSDWVYVAAGRSHSAAIRAE